MSRIKKIAIVNTRLNRQFLTIGKFSFLTMLYPDLLAHVKTLICCCAPMYTILMRLGLPNLPRPYLTTHLNLFNPS